MDEPRFDFYIHTYYRKGFLGKLKKKKTAQIVVLSIAIIEAVLQK